jgi:tetratricopeptide (TPR) repeat protein
MTETTTATRKDLAIESALIDADLFIKYKAHDRAIKLLQEMIERNPRSIQLREKMREINEGLGQATEAARQCLALASLYIAREDFQIAYDRLQEAKSLDPRISIAIGLEALRRARHPEFFLSPQANQPIASPNVVPAVVPENHVEVRRDLAFAGDVSIISIFDTIQVIENSRLTGLMTLKSEMRIGNVVFNLGQIVNAETEGISGTQAFSKIVEFTSGTFEFFLSDKEFPVVIQSSSNTNLILDTLKEIDEENNEFDNF